MDDKSRFTIEILGANHDHPAVVDRAIGCTSHFDEQSELDNTCFPSRIRKGSLRATVSSAMDVRFTFGIAGTTIKSHADVIFVFD
jgi:hypothetical protein